MSHYWANVHNPSAEYHCTGPLPPLRLLVLAYGACCHGQPIVYEERNEVTQLKRECVGTRCVSCERVNSQ